MIRRILVLIGNYLPPKINCFFFKLSGVNLNPAKVWIGNRSYIDTQFPENVYIEDNVCLSYNVNIITHFDPTESIKNHPINRYNKKVKIKRGTFVGPGVTILPGVVIGKNCFIRAGTVIKKSIPDFTIVEGNPQKILGKLDSKLASKINNKNKSYYF